MIEAFVAGGRLLLMAHERELEELLSALDLDLEIELRSPCG